jgi:hypothetical protein
VQATKKLTGGIVEDPDVYGRVNRRLRFTADGRRRHVGLGPVAREEAEQQLHQALAEVERGVWCPPGDQRGPAARRRWAEVRADRRARGLVLLTDLAEQLRMPNLSRHVRAGRLSVAERWGALAMVDPDEALRFRQEMRAQLKLAEKGEGDRRHRFGLDPDFVVRCQIPAFAKRHGLSEAQAEMALRAIVEPVVNDRRKFWLGGRPSRPVATHHHEWLERRDDLHEYYELRARAGVEPMPSHYRICLEVAIEDSAAHPERWRYDPLGEPRAASDRVRNAIKPLLTERKKTPPA